MVILLCETIELCLFANQPRLKGSAVLKVSGFVIIAICSHEIVNFTISIGDCRSFKSFLSYFCLFGGIADLTSRNLGYSARNLEKTARG